MTPRVLLIFLVFAPTAKCLTMAQDRGCSGFKSSPAASISFLEQQIDSRESPCITRAITQLGRARATDAVAVLVRYLDFVDPATAPRPDGFANKRTDYPAIAALFLIGKAATANLLSTIRISESTVIRLNAAKAYQAIYRDNLALGIHILRISEPAAKSAGQENRLREVRKMLAEDCSHLREEEALMCKKAEDNR